MPEMLVAIISPDQESRRILQLAVDETGVARTACTFGEYPLVTNDPCIRRIQDIRADVAIVDLPASGAAAALKTIDFLHAEVPDCAVFTVGDMHQPQVIVSAMRAGAKEFLERP